MKAQELNLEKKEFAFSANIHPDRSHYKFIMSLGRVFPSTRSQAKTFINSGYCLDILNSKDVEIVESLLNKHGYEGSYQYTKSKTMVRLINVMELEKALKAEYDL